MTLQSEPIGSIPRPKELVEAIQAYEKGRLDRSELDEMYDQAVQKTIAEFEATGSPVITDGEQSKPSFATYPIHGLDNLAPDGIKLVFKDGHIRQLPRLTEGPFQYKTYADQYLEEALEYATKPVKQPVISASALSLIYPKEGIAGYPKEKFLDDLVDEAEKEIRLCLQKGAYSVQIDFTEGRLAVKLDPSRELLKSFIHLNNRVLNRFSEAERRRIGIHTCPGGDQDSTHSAEVDYAELLPLLFSLNAGSFYMQFASEPDKEQVLQQINKYMGHEQMIFLGVIDVTNPRVESPEEVRDLILKAAEYIPVVQLGTTDDCGFSPFSDDLSTSRQAAFDMIRARLEGTRLAAKELNL
ncbi:MAG: cobalamin-independent methionine synthase II family protein [Desulfobacterales bacterium]